MSEKKTIRILIIDDDHVDATIIKRHLKHCNTGEIETEYASDLDQGLEKLAASRFDLIFLDNRLDGGVTARDVFERFAQENIKVPVVVVTGMGDQRTAIELMKMGAYDYVTKDDISPEMLEKAIFNTLERNALITKEKELEDTLRSVNFQQKIILDSVHAMIWYNDETGRIWQANKATARAMGLPLEEVIGKKVGELFHCDSEDYVEEDLAIIQSGKAKLNTIKQIQTVDGKRWFQIDKVRYPAGDGNSGVIVFALDVTQRQLAGEKMRQAEKKLIEQDRMKSRFVVNVSHELRTPLCIFKNIISNTMCGVLGPISDKLRNNLEIADRTIDRLSKIITNFLDVSKIEAGKIELQKSKVNISDILAEATDSLGGLAKEKGVRLSVSPLKKNLAFYGDRELTMEILVNLIENAIKFTPVDGAINLFVKDLGDEVEIDTCDTGVGIEENDISKVFHRFSQIEEQVGPGIHGTGLGLYIAKKLVEAQGGRIWAESKPGSGSIFCFTLPKWQKYMEQQGEKVSELLEKLPD